MNAKLRWQANDSTTGVPLSGAKLYSYIATTSTPKATYADEARTSANANPLVADSAGYFGSFYCVPGEPYKFVLKTSGGTTIWTQDNVYADESTLVTSAIQTRLNQVASNPLYYGAVGDGVADESADVQAAIDAATGVVDLLGKTYRCDSVLTIGSNKELRNGTLDFSNCSASACISVTGVLGSEKTLTVDAADDQSVITLDSVSDFAVGDFFCIYASPFATFNAPEIGRVKRINGLTIETMEPLLSTHYVVSSEIVKKIYGADNIRFCHLKIVGNGAGVTEQHLIRLTYATNIVVDSCLLQNPQNNASAAAVFADCCANVRVSGCDIVTDTYASSAIGVRIGGGSSATMIESCRISGMGYGVYSSRSNMTSVLSSIITGRSVGIGSQTSADISQCGLLVSGCTICGLGYSVSFMGTRISLSGNYCDKLINVFANAKTDRTSQNGIIVSNNIADSVIVTSTDNELGSVVVEGNTFNGGGIAVLTDSADPTGKVVISSNTCSSAISVEEALDVIVRGNSALNMIVSNCTSIIISGNNTGTPLSNGSIYILSSTTHFNSCVISGNRVYATNLYCLHVNGVSNGPTGLCISGNSFYLTSAAGANDWVVLLQGYISGVVISGNQLIREDNDDDNIHLVGAAAGAITNCTVSGNYISGGAYCIGEPTDANNTNIIAMGNVLVSGTADVEGTVTVGTGAAADSHNL